MFIGGQSSLIITRTKPSSNFEDHTDYSDRLRFDKVIADHLFWP